MNEENQNSGVRRQEPEVSEETRRRLAAEDRLREIRGQIRGEIRYLALFVAALRKENRHGHVRLETVRVNEGKLKLLGRLFNKFFPVREGRRV